MRGHFRYLRFKTFPMTPRTPQCEVFWALLLNPKHSGVPEDSKSPTLGVLGFTPTLGQSGVATHPLPTMWHASGLLTFMPILMRTLRRRSCSHGSQAKPVLWWPPGSLGVGTTIHPSGSSFIMDLLDLLLPFTKSRADSLVKADLVSAE
jgi:hypothetical protein